jgi:hypothetical protein
MKISLTCVELGFDTPFTSLYVNNFKNIQTYEIVLFILETKICVLIETCLAAVNIVSCKRVIFDSRTDTQVNCLLLLSDFKQNLYQSIKPSKIPTNQNFLKTHSVDLSCCMLSSG